MVMHRCRMIVNKRNILNRLEAYTSTGEDISVDLRENNGVIPKYNDFWKIVAVHIEEKTAVDGTRHSSSSGDNDVVVNMALASSHADLHRTCKEIADSNENDINIHLNAHIIFLSCLRRKQRRVLG